MPSHSAFPRVDAECTWAKHNPAAVHHKAVHHNKAVWLHLARPQYFVRVATAAVKSSAEARPFEKRTTKVSKISNTAVLRDPRATVKGTTTSVSEISSNVVLRICALGVRNCGESNSGKEQRADFDQASGFTHPFVPVQPVLFPQPNKSGDRLGKQKIPRQGPTEGVNSRSLAACGAMGAASMT
jgi:hypothetical protein